MEQTYHIEALAPDARKGESVKRLSLRLPALAEAERRAVEMLRVTQAPQWDGERVEAVRVIDGRGAELFRWTIWDEMSGGSGKR